MHIPQQHISCFCIHTDKHKLSYVCIQSTRTHKSSRRIHHLVHPSCGKHKPIYVRNPHRLTSPAHAHPSRPNTNQAKSRSTLTTKQKSTCVRIHTDKQIKLKASTHSLRNEAQTLIECCIYQFCFTLLYER